jgi:tetratricopeptide (TPR) repeat protein
MDLLGRAYFMSGQYKLATDWLEKAVVADPSNAGYYDWLGRAYGRRAETSSFVTALSYASRTRENFEKAVTLDPVNLEALSDLFECYLEAPRVLGGGMDKAEAIAARIGRLDAAEFECKLAEIAEKRNDGGTVGSLRKTHTLAPVSPFDAVCILPNGATNGHPWFQDDSLPCRLRRALGSRPPACQPARRMRSCEGHRSLRQLV